MVRVLHVFNMMGNGGIEHFVMERYRNINRDELQFDFLMTSEQEGYFDKEIKNLGGKVFHSVDLKKNPVKAFLEIRRIIKCNGYDIVHRHSGNAIGYFDLLAARSAGAKHLILHSHNNSAERLLIHKVFKTFFSISCTRFACSKAAGEWMFGKADFTIIPNSINVKKFCYDRDVREQIRNRYGLNTSFVIGHVGRFDNQKNHSFLIDIFKEVVKIRSNSRLVLVGEGPLQSMIKEKIESLSLVDKVIFLGNISNVNEVMNAFDAFCLPSKYEGFGITLLEAQANGLPCFTSKGRVPVEVNVGRLVRYISLEKSPCDWAQCIISNSDSRNEKAYQYLLDEGYDLKESVSAFERFYKELG